IGSYFYEKYGNVYHVTVFVMNVTEEAAVWPEQGLRERAWLRPDRAVARIEERGLRELIRSVTAEQAGRAVSPSRPGPARPLSFRDTNQEAPIPFAPQPGGYSPPGCGDAQGPDRIVARPRRAGCVTGVSGKPAARYNPPGEGPVMRSAKR